MTLDHQLKKMGFGQASSNPCLYINSEEELFVIAVYVDDMVPATKSKNKIEEVKRTLCAQFEVKDLGELHYILGVTVNQHYDKNSIWIGQPTYTGSIIEKLRLENTKSVATPVSSAVKLIKATEQDELFDANLYESAVGNLQYLSTMTQPDCCVKCG